jgi:hypothetical protein
MSLGPPPTIEPLVRDMKWMGATQAWPLLVVIIVAGLALYLAVKYLASETVTSRGPLVIGHIAAAALAIGIGGWQFLPELRSHRPRWHRWVGRDLCHGESFRRLNRRVSNGQHNQTGCGWAWSRGDRTPLDRHYDGWALGSLRAVLRGSPPVDDPQLCSCPYPGDCVSTPEVLSTSASRKRRQRTPFLFGRP